MAGNVSCGAAPKSVDETCRGATGISESRVLYLSLRLVKMVVKHAFKDGQVEESNGSFARRQARNGRKLLKSQARLRTDIAGLSSNDRDKPKCTICWTCSRLGPYLSGVSHSASFSQGVSPELDVTASHGSSSLLHLKCDPKGSVPRFLSFRNTFNLLVNLTRRYDRALATLRPRRIQPALSDLSSGRKFPWRHPTLR